MYVICKYKIHSIYRKALIIGFVHYDTFSGVSVILKIRTWNSYSVLDTILYTFQLFLIQSSQHFETGMVFMPVLQMRKLRIRG